MESHPQNPEFRNNPENFHPCLTFTGLARSSSGVRQLMTKELADGLLVPPVTPEPIRQR